MLTFLNNLKQTISFKIISLMGYVLCLIWLTLIFLTRKVVDYIFYAQEELVKNTAICVLFLKSLIILVFPIIILVLFIIGILEYKKRENKFKNENKKNILFNIGLVFTLCWPLTFLINYLLDIYIELHKYTLLD